MANAPRLRTTLGLLHVIAGMSKTQYATEVLGLPNLSFWASLTAPAATQWVPAPRMEKILADLNSRVQGITFNENDLRLPVSEFVELFRGKEIYARLLRETGRASDSVEVHNEYSPYFGQYLGLYVCRSEARKPELAIGYDIYLIKPGRDRGSALIQQLSDPFAARGEIVNSGRFSVVNGDTIQFDIEYRDRSDPRAMFMASVPQGEKKSFLALCLDIKGRARAVAARPVLFLKVAAPFSGSKMLESDTRAYTLVKQILTDSIYIDPDSFEVLRKAGRQILEDDEDELEEALNSTRPLSAM